MMCFQCSASLSMSGQVAPPVHSQSKAAGSTKRFVHYGKVLVSTGGSDWTGEMKNACKKADFVAMRNIAYETAGIKHVAVRPFTTLYTAEFLMFVAVGHTIELLGVEGGLLAVYLGTAIDHFATMSSCATVVHSSVRCAAPDCA